MVLESLTNPFRAEKRPYNLFFYGVLYSSVAILLSLWIFKEEASLIMVFLTVLASTPLVYNTIKYEEEKDKKSVKELPLLKEHAKALSLFVFLFLGMLFAFSMWFIFLPQEATETSFRTQIATINSINAKVLGNSLLSATSSISSGSDLVAKIFFNNLKVLIFCILFALFYGAGAIFILTWNASVISAAIGSFIRNNLSIYANELGFAKIGGYFHIFSLGLLKYLIHGIPEILAYFMGGLAGGIISVAIIKHDLMSKNFKKITYDSVDLLLLSIVILFVAALLEVYITPILF